MLPSLRGLRRRLAAVGPGFVDAFLRDNRVLPPVLALLALLVFAWIVAGTYVGDPDEERVSNQANVAQEQNAQGADPAAPELENRDVDSYAAYRNKDPFRQLLAPAEDTPGEPADGTTPPDGGADDTGDGSTTGTAPADDNRDSDNDGLTDTREEELFQDPQNPDTDGDGILDGAEDADGDGQPDGTTTGTGASASPGAGTAGGNGGGDAGDDASVPASGDAGDDASGGGRGRGGDRGGRGDGRDRPGRGDDLLDSGGTLHIP